jgi:hypothetical protein
VEALAAAARMQAGAPAGPGAEAADGARLDAASAEQVLTTSPTHWPLTSLLGGLPSRAAHARPLPWQAPCA